MSSGGPPQRLNRIWSFTAPPAVALDRLRSAVATEGGRIDVDAERSLTARFGSKLRWALFGPIYPADRRRCPAVVALAVTPERGGCQVSAQAEIGGHNFFPGKVTRHLYDERLTQLLDVLQTASQ